MKTTTPNPSSGSNWTVGCCGWSPDNYDWSSFDYNWTDSGADYADDGDYYEEQVPVGMEHFFFIDKVSALAGTVNSHLSAVTVVVNLLHLLVLLHKKTRSSAVFIFMIGIAVADIPNFAFSIHDDATEFKFSPTLVYKTGYFCIKEKWKVIDVYGQIVSSGYGMTRRISIWLALLLALVRTMSVMFPMSGRIQKLTTPLSTVIFILMTFLVCCLWETGFLLWYARVFKIIDVTPKKCLAGLDDGEKWILVIPFAKDVEFDFNQLFIETVFKWTPAIVYPILTVLLFVELRAIKARRRTLSKEERRGEHTTLLILVMTFSFSVTEFVSGIVLFINLNIYEGIAWYSWDSTCLIDATSVFVIKHCLLYLSITLRCFNSFFHPIVCLFISSQYRDTVEGVVLQNPIGRTVSKMFQSRKGSGRSSKISSSSLVSPTSIA